MMERIPSSADASQLKSTSALHVLSFLFTGQNIKLWPPHLRTGQNQAESHSPFPNACCLLQAFPAAPGHNSTSLFQCLREYSTARPPCGNHHVQLASFASLFPKTPTLREKNQKNNNTSTNNKKKNNKCFQGQKTSAEILSNSQSTFLLMLLQQICKIPAFLQPTYLCDCQQNSVLQVSATTLR